MQTNRLVLLLAAGLAACSSDATHRLIYVHSQAQAGTATQIFVNAASRRATEREVFIDYTVETVSAARREAYPGQPQRIEAAIAFDCRTRRYRKLREVAYGFDGRAQPPDALSLQPGEIPPRSEAEVLLDYACASAARRWWTRYPVVRTD